MKNRIGHLVGAMVVVCSLLQACGGERSPSFEPPTQTITSPREASILHLEATGALPVLDRSDSLEGPDINSNGVRDDIERYITKKYPVEAQRRAAMQEARALQATLTVNTSDPLALEWVSRESFRATNCIFSVFSGPTALQQSHQMSREIESMTSNTKARLKAYLAYNRARHGSVSSLPTGDTCE